MVKLGDEVRDTISGFQGIAVSRHSYLQGCDRISIQPPVGPDGKMSEPASFDEPQLEVVIPKKAMRRKEEPPGGPDKYLDRGKDETSDRKT